MRGLILGSLVATLCIYGIFSDEAYLAPSPMQELGLSEGNSLALAGGEASTLECGTDDLWDKAPDHLHREQARLEEDYRTYFSGLGPAHTGPYRAEVQQQRNPPPYTLPIVFHILHNNGTENISDARILTSLDQLNASFANTGYYDQGTGVNTQIQFCLAQRTPDNLVSNGITRTLTTLTNLDADTEDLALKDLARWNPREYVNVYVVREICGLGLGCGVAGYAYYPGAHGSGVDGIVVEARWLGDDEAGNAVLTHELGHYLGLAHTFNGGCTNDDCLTDGDRVCDTPPDNSTAAVPCGSSANTCTTDTDSGFATDQNDMHINYMDYGYFSCYSALTAGQRDRMHFFIEGIRQSLLDSYGCQTPCPNLVTAGFTGAPGGDIIVGSTINLTNTSTGTASYEWYVDGVLEATTTDFSFTFNSPGFFTVRLVALSGDPSLCANDEISINVRVVCPYQADLNVVTASPIEFQPADFSTTDDAPFYEWTVDGMVVGNAADLTYSFPGSGIYELCLRKGTGTCEASSCRTIFVGNSFQPCEGSTFAQFILAPPMGDHEGDLRIQAFRPDGGGFAFAGVINDNQLFLANTTALGQQLWSWSGLVGDPTTILTNLSVDHLLVDNQGNYLVSGTRIGDNFTSGVEATAWLLKFNPATLSVEFFQRQNTSSSVVFMEDFPLANEYLLAGTQFDVATGENRVWQQRIDRTTGQASGTLDLLHELSGNSLQITDGLWANGELFLIGDYYESNATIDRRAVIYNFGADGSLQWAREGHTFPGSGMGDLSAEDIDLDGNSLYLLSQGVASSINGFTGRTYLNEFSLDGQVMNVREYGSGGRYEGLDLQVLNDGFLIYGRVNDNNFQNPFLLRLDQQGGVDWERRYFTGGTDRAFLDGNQHFFATATANFLVGNLGNTAAGTVDGRSYGYFLRLDEFGFFQDECTQLASFETPSTFQQGWTNFNPQAELSDFSWVPGQIFDTPWDWVPNNTCGTPCFEICGNGIDDDFNGDIDCEDAALANTCCCLPGPLPPAINDTTLCPGETWTILVPPYDGGIEWSTGSTSRQFVIDSAATYTLTVTDSCDRDSTISFTVDYLPPGTPPDLGPDQVVCANGLTEMDAGPGWATYLWFDLSTGQTATAWGSGEFWVEVTDSCGQVFGDTLQVTVLPATEIDLGPPDTLVDCGVDSLDFSINGYAEYRWSPSGAVDCSTCPDVRVAVPPVGDSLTLFVLGFTEDGCAAGDSIKIRTSAGLGGFETLAVCSGDSVTYRDSVLTTPGQYLFAVDCSTPDTLLLEELASPMPSTQAVSLCAGDSVFLAGAWQFAPGMVTETLSGANGCDSLHSYDLQLLQAPPPSQDVQQICPGDSAFIAGQWQFSAGHYPEVFVADNGCDSVHTIQLQLLSTPATTQEIVEICTGDSVFIQGDWRFLPGTFSEVLTAANGCDSLHEIELIINDLPAFEFELSPDCATNLTTVTVIPTQGEGPFQVIWNLPAPEPVLIGNIQNLPAGTYEIELLDANNCSILAEVVVPPVEEIDYSISAAFPLCVGAGNAFLLLSPADGLSDVVINGTGFIPMDSIPLIGDGPFSIQLTDTLGCTQDTLINGDSGSSLNVSLAGAIDLPLGDSVLLNPQILGGNPEYSYNWAPAEGLSCTDCLNPFASPLVGTTYQLTVTDANGCIATAEISIRIDPASAVYLPNAFSPNDDGVNDYFFPGLGPAVVQIKRFEIYDRWGGRLHSTTDVPASAPPSNGWDGRVNGQLASVGVYVYLLEVELADGQVIPLAGEVMLLR